MGIPTSRVHVKASEEAMKGRCREEDDLAERCSASLRLSGSFAITYIWAGVVPSNPAEFA